MNRAVTGIFPLIAGLVAASCASVDASGQHNRNFDFSSIERTAVVSVEGLDRNEGAQGQIAAMANQALLRKGYSPVERNQIKQVIEEQEFSRSEVTSSSGAAAVGRILNVDTVILVSVPKYKSEMSMSMQMVDAENGTILWSASGSASEGASGKETGALLGAIAGGATGAVVGNSGTAVVGGAAAGGATGAVAGKGMGPKRQQQSAALIEELMETLPGPG